jgi:peptidoglycan/xylan/chitin deacetylase (PgdA/CDA1 family)
MLQNNTTKPGPHLRIALTFDDGPHPRNTEALIKMLSERIIPATFFVLGSNAKRWPEILRLMHEAGHEIGNHGWSHSSFAALSDADVLNELSRTHQLIREKSSQECRVYRPPYGAITEHQQSLITDYLGYRLSLWNVDSLDWQKPTIDDLIRKATDLNVKRAVLLFHDFSDATRQALPQILDALQSYDGAFYTASRILHDL